MKLCVDEGADSIYLPSTTRPLSSPNKSCQVWCWMTTHRMK